MNMQISRILSIVRTSPRQPGITKLATVSRFSTTIAARSTTIPLQSPCSRPGISFTEAMMNARTAPPSPVLISNLKRAGRRRRSLAAMYKSNEPNLPQVVGVGRAESYNLLGIFEDERVSGLFQITFVDDELEDAIHLTPLPQYRISCDVKDVFIFDDGVVVSWNFDNKELGQLFELLAPYEKLPMDYELTKTETETMPFKYGDYPKVTIKNDVIRMPKSNDEDHAEHMQLLDRYAVSHGLAASVKVGIWEHQLNEYADPLPAVTKSLIKGVIPWQRRKTLQKTGEFAAIRQSINLDAGLLNSDFYWEREHLEKHYTTTIRYFDVGKRLRDLNSRLDYCQNLVSVIDTMQAHKHASFLEWMIIVLIVIEVIFDLLHYFDVTASPVFLVEDPDKDSDPFHPSVGHEKNIVKRH